jgi:hypothetical protein
MSRAAFSGDVDTRWSSSNHCSCSGVASGMNRQVNVLQNAGLRSSQPVCTPWEYLAVIALIAVLVFEKLGVGILRRAWFNLDLIWSAALVATGVLTLML